MKFSALGLVFFRASLSLGRVVTFLVLYMDL